MIREAIDASPDENDLFSSLNHLEWLYERAGFNDEGRFGLVRLAVTQIPQWQPLPTTVVSPTMQC